MQRARGAVTALFFSNGAMFASVLPRLPEVKADLDLSDGQLGLALLGVGLGGMAASGVTGWLLPRVGSQRLAVLAMVAVALCVPLVGVAPSRAVLFVVLIGAGVGDALTDVAMNVSGLEVQRRLGRPLMNGMHAVWSLGALSGGAVATAAAALDVPLFLHLATVGALLVGVCAAAYRHVPDHHGAGEHAPGSRVRITPALVLLCGMAVLAALLEDAPASWSAIYLSDHTGAEGGAAGLAYTAFMAAMVGGRLVGDKVVEKLGLLPVVRGGALLAAVALAVALLEGSTTSAVVAFACVGLGAAPLFPAMFTAAGELPGQGVAAMNVAARLGFLASPPVVGTVADGVGLPLALGLLVVPAAASIALLAGAVRPPARG